MKSIFILLSLLTTFIWCEKSLTTTFVTDNGGDGSVFDIVTLQPIVVNDFDINCDTGTRTYYIYTKLGSYDGFLNSVDEWTLIKTDSVVCNDNKIKIVFIVFKFLYFV